MAEKSTIARPYAQAVFELAQAAGEYQTWSDILQTVAVIVVNEDIRRLIGNTSVSKAQVAGLIIEVAGGLSEQAQNLVKLLAENRRLGVMAEIVEQYEVLRAEAERTVDAEVVSATAMSAEQQAGIAAKLKIKLGREVSLTVSVDESLMGGAIIKAGDMVIDGSVSGQLNKLSVELAG